MITDTFDHSSDQERWPGANQAYLAAAVALVRARLEEYIAERQGKEDYVDRADALRIELAQAAAALPTPAALENLCVLFGLTPFERELLLLCAGVELDSSFAILCGRAQHATRQTAPTFGLALAAFPDAHWSALSPGAPLRHWRLIDVRAGDSLVTSPLRIDERVLHYLAGVRHLDENLYGFVLPISPAECVILAPSQLALAQRVAVTWSREADSGVSPAVQLCGREVAAKRAIAAAVAADLGLDLHLLPAHALPSTPYELDALIRLWEREAALSNSALLLDCEDVECADAARAGLINRFVDELGCVLFVTGPERRQVRHRPLLTFDVTGPTAEEQRTVWHAVLGEYAPGLNGDVPRLVAQFDLTLPAIYTACSRATDVVTDATPPQELARRLWDACRTEARSRLDNLAQRIDPVATWADLVLPPQQLATLREVAVHVRQRTQVYENWGFAAKSAQGLGISALFAGPSGTGKTMAAEVLANAVRLDLYRIDLSQVVSKYIGETEKNLRRVFDAAEEGGAILLFDEADALFGKRSEVKDSHDRYANIEISYLLQRMEAYRGLAILTTNLKKALDGAFLRRIRFMVHFPFPDAEARAEIWQRVFPVQTPTAGLDLEKLAQLNVAGGHIRNIALNAAFLAADGDEPVRMDHIVRAAQTEYAKLEKPLTGGEIRGWT